MAKQFTRAQAEQKKTQAAEFLERIGEPDRAQEFDDMSVEEYAEHKGFQISNPRTRQRSNITMANRTVSKSDLQDQLDQAIEVLDESYQPESTREDLAAAVGNALDILRGEDDDDDEDEDDDSED